MTLTNDCLFLQYDVIVNQILTVMKETSEIDNGQWFTENTSTNIIVPVRYDGFIH